VAGRPASPTAGGSSGIGSTATIAIVAGLIVLAALAAFLLRRRSGTDRT
jgi:LPXTG-motif cell wall-anchored protein